MFYALVLNCRTVEENSLVDVYSSIGVLGSARLLGNRPSAAHPTPGGRRGRFLPKKATNHQTNGPRLFMRGPPGHARGGAHSVASAGRAVPRAPSDLASRLYGRMADALAVAGEEGRGKLR